MKAILCTKYGPPDALQFREVAKPVPKEDEVLVKVHAASLNMYDWHLLTADIFLVRLMGGGLFRPKFTIPGVDIAGQIEVVGSNAKQFKPGDDVYGDISVCGGGFAEYAARRHVHTTGLTLSSEQLVYAQERLQSQSLQTFSKFKLQDYRDEVGQYDGIASIEMFEAVGGQYWDSYFACIKRNLKPGARACIQTITIDDALFERYRDGTDFIQQYIFPGGMLPSQERFEALAQAHGLLVENKLAFGNDYALTLRHWREAFINKEPIVRAQGFDTRFIKMWEFYLAYCEAGFNSRSTDVVQYTLRKPS